MDRDIPVHQFVIKSSRLKRQGFRPCLCQVEAMFPCNFTPLVAQSLVATVDPMFKTWQQWKRISSRNPPRLYSHSPCSALTHCRPKAAEGPTIASWHRKIIHVGSILCLFKCSIHPYPTTMEYSLIGIKFVFVQDVINRSKPLTSR